MLGFQVIGAHDMDDLGWRGAVERIKARVGDRPTYVSLDIDVLDPAFAPGTGTPEAGGLTSRELLQHPARASPTSTSSAPTSSRSRRPTTTPRSPASPPSHAAYELISAMAPADRAASDA